MKNRITLLLTWNLTLAAIAYAAGPSATPSPPPASSPQVPNGSSPEIQAITRLDKDYEAAHNRGDANAVAASDASSRLQNLAWMVGSWQDEANDTKMEATVNWTEGQNFLTRRFNVRRSDGKRSKAGR
jgi:hypothetical protein